jgi:hypothetical protein
MHLTPVEAAARAFGGVARLARALACDRTSVMRWKAPRSSLRRGCSGDFPRPELIRLCLVRAKAMGLDLDEAALIHGREVADAPRIPPAIAADSPKSLAKVGLEPTKPGGRRILKA